MRPNTSSKRLRSRNRSKSGSTGGGSGGGGGGGGNPLSRSYESNGPDVKIRGSALQVADKYAQLARDAQSSGDRVMAENYFQHAEHYYRIISAAYEQMGQVAPQPRREDGQGNASGNGFDMEDDDEGLRRAIRVNGGHQPFGARDEGEEEDGEEEAPQQFADRRNGGNGNGGNGNGYARDDRREPRADDRRDDRREPRADDRDRREAARPEARSEPQREPREEPRRQDARRDDERRDPPRRDDRRDQPRRDEPRRERRFVPIDAEQPFIEPVAVRPVAVENAGSPPATARSEPRAEPIGPETAPNEPAEVISPTSPAAELQPPAPTAEALATEPAAVDAAADAEPAEAPKRRTRAPRGTSTRARTRRTEPAAETPAAEVTE